MTINTLKTKRFFIVLSLATIKVLPFQKVAISLPELLLFNLYCKFSSLNRIITSQNLVLPWVKTLFKKFWKTILFQEV